MVPAAIAYATIGSAAIGRLGAILHRHTLIGTVLAAAGVVLVLAGLEGAGCLLDRPALSSDRLLAHRREPGSPPQMARPQLVGTLITFLVGAILATAPATTSSLESTPGSPNGDHMTSLAGLGLQLTLMTVLALGTILTIEASGTNLATPIILVIYPCQTSFEHLESYYSRP